MASAQSRKRAPQELHCPNEKIKSGRTPHQPSKNICTAEHLYCRYWPPHLWDNLSRVPLARIALRELDRRNSAPRPAPAPAVRTADLARFARHGGPDLRHLRGYTEPEGAVHIMASPSTATRVKIEPAKTPAYNVAFEQLMIDYSAYPVFHYFPDNPDATIPEPNNLEEEREVLSKRRPSLDSFTEREFQVFRRNNDAATTKAIVDRTVVLFIAGMSDIPSGGKLLFSNLEAIAQNVIKPAPDFFDGAHLMAIHKKIRSANEDGNLSKLIIPTNDVDTPVLPNFFMEIKSPTANARVAQRQAMHVGAIGARAMQAVMNYGKEEPSYDGNAYTFSSTYCDGRLKLFAHHVAPPTAPGGRPKYYMTLVDSWSLDDSIDSFRKGVTAFRNARDRARWHRDNFIQAANARAHQSDGAAPPEAETGVEPATSFAISHALLINE